ncbi:MAG: hypothetical protein K0R59_792 [Sphingobacterium sp.]|jgi:hypothetical protein|uniref:SMI1/KNR4 family protein n=1 Tax=Sphingobacterium sp. CZ-UAM TaxID=1933868 RepID=UPI00098731DD|nr:SMI1/KNR4 family protein [Sphingobacterium sp. CZ-UAM]MDF2515496.1 hypothetical protein [Sphingobacterium sp.]OOG16130.1 hypothetical protein BWD42_22390 [Sphingobacterium sp. CZ-UAM]
MEIQHLKHLQDNPMRNPHAEIKYKFENEPMPLAEIEALEQKYNNSKPFPKALRELLYLAGRYCYVFDYNALDSMDEVQEYVRESLAEFNRDIGRPFFAIDLYGGIQAFYVCLDEGDDPAVYGGVYEGTDGAYPDWNFKVAETLSSHIYSRIERSKKGENIF